MFLSNKKYWPPYYMEVGQFGLAFAFLIALFDSVVHSRDVRLLDCSCPRSFHPICGTDQQTYDSRCFLDCAAKYDQELGVAYEGVCCPRAELCADYFDPVCDQMGNFYENDCIFDFHKCVQRRTSGKLLRVEGRGERMCRQSEGKPRGGTPMADGVRIGGQRQQQKQQSICEFYCAEVVSPVCDSQGRTHKNRCKFDLTSCRLRSRGIISALHIVREGPCRKEEANFSQFPNANSMRKMSLANLMEGIRRERARKKLNLPMKGNGGNGSRSREEAEGNGKMNNGTTLKSGEQQPTTQLVMDWRRKENKSGSWAGSREEEILEIPASKLFRDEHQRGGQTANEGRSWQLSLLQTQSSTSQIPPKMPMAPSSPPPAAGSIRNDGNKKEQPTATTTTNHRKEVPFGRSLGALTKFQQLGQPNVQIVDGDECQSASSSACPSIWDPLCDTHNQTHPNECHFNVARCEFARSASQTESPPRIAYRGKCAKFVSKSNGQALECNFCKNEEEILPVCDNTNLTHQSVCLFAQWNCGKRVRGVEEHLLAHVGECSLLSPIFELKDEICPAKCSRHYKPVCDSNGSTHPNLCTYQMHSCHQRKAGRPFGWLISLRECGSPNQSNNSANPTASGNGGISRRVEPRPKEAAPNGGIECPEEPNCGESDNAEDGPICDSEGKIHKNSCQFTYAHCMAAKGGKILRIVEEEQCPGIVTMRREGKEKEMANTATATTPLHHHHQQQQPSLAQICEIKWPNCGTSPQDPHCGSDFITYRNFCAIQKAQCMDKRLEILFKGQCEQCLGVPCPPPNPQADDRHFVCDQSGETKSKCEFEMLRCIYEAKFGYNITAAYEGRCCPNTEGCQGGEEGKEKEQPICDSNGRQHPNRCHFEVAKCRAEKIGRKGPKLEERYCPLMEGRGGGGGRKEDKQEEEEGEKATAEVQKIPITGIVDAAMEAYGGGGGGIALKREEPSNQQRGPPSAETAKTDSSADQLKNVSAELLSVKEMICSDKYEPICGSDGRTYRNGCHLDRHNASSNSGHYLDGFHPVKALYSGECCPGPGECGPEYSPICDNQGNTHLNLCQFGRQRCLAERRRAQNLTIMAYALCPGLHCPTEKCPSRYEPVCATNGHVYANLCELDKSVCVVRSGIRKGGNEEEEEQMDGQTKRAALALDYIGECCEMTVECGGQPQNGNGPICDNLGRQYKDQCHFMKFACLARKRDGQSLRPIQCQSPTTTTMWRRKHRRHRRRTRK